VFAMINHASEVLVRRQHRRSIVRPSVGKPVGVIIHGAYSKTPAQQFLSAVTSERAGVRLQWAINQRWADSAAHRLCEDSRASLLSEDDHAS
jgi:hypothetical protein